MPYTIAVAGKGGVGKTTLTGMMIQRLAEQKKGPILAVDADANSNLNEVLGVEVEMTLGDIRDELSNAELSNESPIPTSEKKLHRQNWLKKVRFRKECPNRTILNLSLIPHWWRKMITTC